ncbi:MAG: MMPL family transporter, partial [Nitrospinae bacterium]|nr:MMPL family transporter [Nitrospinota bacterium]
NKRIFEKNPDLLPAFLQPERGFARLSLQMKTVGNDEFNQIRDEVQKIFTKYNLYEEYTIVETGQFPLIMHIQDYLVSTLLESFCLSFAIISFCFFILFRNVKLSLIAMLPNLFPLFMCLIALRSFNYSFDVGTIMIASIILGIVVDATAHFIYRYRVVLNKTGNVQEAVVQAMNITGNPILISGFILGTGFLVFIFSGFLPIHHFGVLASLAIFSGMVGDLILLPAALLFFNNKG